MKPGITTVLLIAASVLPCPRAAATVRLPPVFSNHMVLQRDATVPVWGWANPGEEVTVTIAGQTKTATAGPDRKWGVKLEKLAAGGPHTLTVKGKNTLTITDVMVGEVWLASGQSNMVTFVVSCLNFEKE